MSSDHQNASQIAIALFRDRTELLFAAGRILPRDEPDFSPFRNPRRDAQLAHARELRNTTDELLRMESTLKDNAAVLDDRAADLDAREHKLRRWEAKLEEREQELDRREKAQASAISDAREQQQALALLEAAAPPTTPGEPTDEQRAAMAARLAGPRITTPTSGPFVS
jgi:peptidoglycan hydrolase CwlO-like protein